MTRITVELGDITRQRVDAIVNAANRAMRGGGGVDGAIHRAGGPAVLAECVERFPRGLDTGDAGWTIAGNMPAGHVIHTVGPNFGAGETDPQLLTSCYRRSLEVADELGAKTVAFPLISAGIYRWPIQSAVEIAIDTVAQSPTRVDEVRFVAFDQAIYDRLRAAALAVSPPEVAPGSIGALFDPEPAQWGYRGDPYLWRELRAQTADVPVPATADELKADLLERISRICDLNEEDASQVPAFNPGHGMSAGQVNTQWWLNIGLPAIVGEAFRPGK
ncbi:O-acetyl-ADP-ribose deacetylase [Leucobacter sp. cx-169]|uniref:O-acetyl-ADP-ribose deacetylase n=1 Tax=Leucobacter sp. cx-169 TaxID=2770549 RepID=UPI00165DD588|nr:O-acetyl-ADP-ribose deacetylase [Leucobacter sp. cx-169]MBC9927242.1 O-acetyl-ADP-ribose deacetylase [Leucobacter sp. cx-169]